MQLLGHARDRAGTGHGSRYHPGTSHRTTNHDRTRTGTRRNNHNDDHHNHNNPTAHYHHYAPGSGC